MPYKFVVINGDEVPTIVTMQENEFNRAQELNILDMECSCLEEYLLPLADCQSPIERLLGLALHDLDICVGVAWAHEKNGAVKETLGRMEDIDFTAQEVIKARSGCEYHVDYFVSSSFRGLGSDPPLEIGVAVECDGHSFHEKTKAQAKRDKKRDRDFALSGIPILHFTGSEIWKDPRQCVGEIVDFIINEVRRKCEEGTSQGRS